MVPNAFPHGTQHPHTHDIQHLPHIVPSLSLTWYAAHLPNGTQHISPWYPASPPHGMQHISPIASKSKALDHKYVPSSPWRDVPCNSSPSPSCSQAHSSIYFSVHICKSKKEDAAFWLLPSSCHVVLGHQPVDGPPHPDARGNSLHSDLGVPTAAHILTSAPRQQTHLLLLLFTMVGLIVAIYTFYI